MNAIWLDAQLSPLLAHWISQRYQKEVIPLRDLGLRDAKDKDIFEAAKKAQAMIVTKDSDFINLLDRYGSPPQIIWLRCGNTSNERMKSILSKCFPQALALLAAGEDLVEINDA